MTEPKPTYAADTDKPGNDRLIEHTLKARQFTIGLTLEYERMLESLGRPVESAIVDRRERRAVRRGKRR